MFYPLVNGGDTAEAAAEARQAAAEAKAAAAACEGIVIGNVTITDDTTADVYRLGINQGLIYREEM